MYCIDDLYSCIVLMYCIHVPMYSCIVFMYSCTHVLYSCIVLMYYYYLVYFIYDISFPSFPIQLTFSSAGRTGTSVRFTVSSLLSTHASLPPSVAASSHAIALGTLQGTRGATAYRIAGQPDGSLLLAAACGKMLVLFEYRRDVKEFFKTHVRTLLSHGCRGVFIVWLLFGIVW